MKTYIVPADFSVSNPRFLDENSSFNIPAGELADQGDEVAAADASQVVGMGHMEFASDSMDEWSDLIAGASSRMPVHVPVAVEVITQPEFPFDVQAESTEQVATEVVEVEEASTVEEPTGEGKEETETAAIDAVENGDRDFICSQIIEVKTEIRLIDSTISRLAAELKELKKSRGDKLETLLELSEELEKACGGELVDSSPAGQGEADTATETEDQSSTDSADPNNSQFDTYNPWDKWEQGDSISVVRVLVDQPPTESGVLIPAGSALETYDVEPPQDTGDSLTGIVKAFLPNSRETIVISKRECGPLVHWIKEARVGWRIGEAPVEDAKEKLRARMRAGESQPGRDQGEEDVSWKTVSVSALRLPKSLETILVEDNSIKTIGDIAEWTRWNQLVDLKKVGEAKAEKIQEALDEFWKTRGA